MNKVRDMTLADAEKVAAIYNQGIEERIATFETKLRDARDIFSWMHGSHPALVIEKDGEVIAFAVAFRYKPRACYDGVAEFSVYVDRPHRRGGVGRIAMNALIDKAKAAGFWKLLSRVFVENQASRSLLLELGFREVGVYYKHAQLDGEWRDVVIVEKLLID